MFSITSPTCTELFRSFDPSNTNVPFPLGIIVMFLVIVTGVVG